MKATDTSTCSRIYPPRPAEIEVEVEMQNTKHKILETVRRYMRSPCDKNGKIKGNNLMMTNDRA